MNKKTLFSIFAFLLFTVQTGYSSVSDATWNAIIDKYIIFKMTDQSQIAAKLIAYKDSMVTIVKQDGSIESIDAKNVESVTMKSVSNSEKNSTDEQIDKSFRKEKTCGPIFGFGPQVIGFNADIKNINIFVTASLLIPLVSDGDMYAFSAGAGKLIKLGSRGWKFNAFSHVSFLSKKDELWDSENIVYKEGIDFNTAIGVGVGFQYISPKGILFSFKLPILGFNFSNYQMDGDGVLLYYPYSGASLPAIVFGKSF